MGVCGGYQMLGNSIYDRHNIESKVKTTKGLGVLPMVTEICAEKVLSQIKAVHLSSGFEITGYEIHHGKAKITGNLKPVLEIHRSGNENVKRNDGMITEDGRCWGTYVHGIFDNDDFRRYFLNNIRTKKGWPALKEGIRYDVDREIQKLADFLRKNMDMDLLYKILEHGNKG